MFNYGDKVRFIRDGKVGEVIGFMRGCEKCLVKFNGDTEKWIPDNNLERVEKDDDET